MEKWQPKCDKISLRKCGYSILKIKRNKRVVTKACHIEIGINERRNILKIRKRKGIINFFIILKGLLKGASEFLFDDVNHSRLRSTNCLKNEKKKLKILKSYEDIS